MISIGRESTITESQQLVEDVNPASTFAVLCLIVAVVVKVSTLSIAKPIFRFCPTLLWIFLLPMLAASCGIIPTKSIVYDGIGKVLLPAALVIFLLGTDIREIRKMGLNAFAIALFGSFSVILSGLGCGIIFGNIYGSEVTQTIPVLVAGWVGGYTGLLALNESVELPAEQFAPMLMAASVLTYSWIGILSAFTGWQRRFDAWTGAKPMSTKTTATASPDVKKEGTALTVSELAIWVSVCMAISCVAFRVAAYLPSFPPTFTTKAVGFLILLGLGIGLSCASTVRKSFSKAQPIGSYALLLLIAAFGARGRLQDLTGTGKYFIYGVSVLVVHSALMILFSKLLKSPLALTATASQANIGGVSSAPIVANAYQPGTEPIAILMSIFTSILAIPAGLLVAYSMEKLF